MEVNGMGVENFERLHIHVILRDILNGCLEAIKIPLLQGQWEIPDVDAGGGKPHDFSGGGCRECWDTTC